MKTVEVAAEYKLVCSASLVLGYGALCIDFKKDPHTYKVCIELDRKAILLCSGSVVVSSEFTTLLAEREVVDYDSLPGTVQNEIDEVCANFDAAAFSVGNFIKYKNGIAAISEEPVYPSRMEFLLSTQSGSKPCRIPRKGVITHHLDRYFCIDPAEQLEYQKAFNHQSAAPFEAMRFLHNAKNEERANYKWIDATIAAELGVKEAISRKSEDASRLILHLPAPPITKLYGAILESFFGEKSPYLKELDDGMQKRNKLVHSPGAISLTTEEADRYVEKVELALFHLMTLLYPDDYFSLRNYTTLKSDSLKKSSSKS